MEPDLLDFDDQLNLLDEIEAEEREESRLKIVVPEEELPTNPKLPRLDKEVSNAATVNVPSMEIYQHLPSKRRKTVLPSERKKPQQIEVIKESLLHRRIPVTLNYVPITFSDGHRRYLTIEDTVTDNASLGISIRRPLLLHEFSALIKNAEQLIKFRKMSTAVTLNFETSSSLDQHFSNLWTKKYEPTRYLDLISSENINRQLLCWLNSWNCYVFGTKPKAQLANEISPPPRPPPLTPAEEAKKSWKFDSANKNSKFTKFERPNEEVTISQLDSRDGRPVYRLVLLSGPPGLGKTTLAHLLARHAGYQVLETNSSDDRSPKAIKDLLEAVASDQSTLNTAANAGTDESQLKPTCLILDEVDGALPAAVELLAEAACNTQSGLTGGKSKKKKGKLFLRRPVICICNDLYAPSLRPLRAPGVPCYVMRLPNVDLNRLVTRLNWIADQEQLDLDKHFLSTLAESSGRDIRACLNVLQFVKAMQMQKKGKDLSVNNLLSVLETSGKDTQHNLFSAWEAVFTIPPSQVLTRCINSMTFKRQALTPAAPVTSSDSSLQARVAHTLEICSSAGEPQTLILGLFENYLGCRMKDASLQMALKASEWLVYSDHLYEYIQTAQDYSVMRYTRVLPVWFHLSFASAANAFVSRWKTNGGEQDRLGALKWPTSYSENLGAHRKSQAIVESLLENQWRAGNGGLLTSLSNENTVHDSLLTGLRFLTRGQFLLDAVSYLNMLITAISTSLRPVNSQLYNQQERQQLAHLMGLMITLGLDWVPQQSTETDETTYKLEPPLDALAAFTSSWKSEKELPYATKQMLARELKLERMRRVEASYNGTAVAVVIEPTSQVVTAAPIDRSRPMLDSFMMERLAPTAAPLAASVYTEKVKRDFFGRPIIEKKVVCESKENLPPAPSCPINQAMWFKFKEGHSNAVRRPFLMSQLI